MPIDLDKKREYTRKYLRGWRKRNRERANAIIQRYRDKNRVVVREKTREQMRRWRSVPANRERVRDQQLRAKYGVGVAERRTMVESQGGGCGLCRRSLGTDERRWHTDHDHATGAVRAILCGPCNRGIGMFSESTERLQLAIEYLRQHGKDDRANVEEALSRSHYVRATIGEEQKLLAGMRGEWRAPIESLLADD